MSAGNHGCLRTVLWIVGIIFALQLLSGILGAAFGVIGVIGDSLFGGDDYDDDYYNDDYYEDDYYDDPYYDDDYYGGNYYDEHMYDEYIAARLEDYYRNQAYYDSLNKKSFTYSVYVDWMGFSGSSTQYTVGRYDERVLTEHDIPQDTQFRFEGLFSQPNGGVQYVNAAGYLIRPISDDITLYAVYTDETVGTAPITQYQ